MKEIRLGDYIELLTDYHSGGSYKILRENTKILHKPNYAVMLRTLNFERNDFTNDLIYCDKQSYDFLEYSHLQENDVLMNKIANPGSVYIMPKLNYRATCAMNLFLLRFKKINQRYLYYVMNYHEDYIKTKAHGTTTKTITKDEVRDLVFKIHDTIEEQNKIEKLLSSIEDKIALNNKTNTELENMAKTIYNYWFTQFDFPDKNGHPYKTYGGQMVYNEILKREIPAGWEGFKLEKCLSRIATGLNPRDNFVLGNGNIKYLTVKNLNTDGTIDFSNCDLIDEEALKLIHARSDIKKGDILFASIAPLGRCYLIQDTPKEWDINESVFSIRPNTDLISSIYLYMFFMDESFVKLAQSNSTGSVFKGIRINDLYSIPILVPEKQIMEKFSETITPIMNMKYRVEKENKELIELRDYLLPLLMNGQITIKE